MSTDYSLFVYAVLLARFFVVVLGAAYAGALVASMIPTWKQATRIEKALFWTMLAYSANVSVFTALVVSDEAPVDPRSFVFFGFLLTFLLGHRLLYTARRRS